MTILAIDAGTSAIKAAVITDDGVVIDVVRKSVASRSSPGIDPLIYWECVADAIRATSSKGQVIDAIAVTGQGDGLWTLAEDGQPAGQAFEWNATVAADVIRGWEANSTIEHHYRNTGTVLWAGVSAALWTWLKSADPPHAERTRHVFSAKDWINYQLCGVVATDITDATIPFLDLETGEYGANGFDSLGCPELRSKLAPITANGSTIGLLSPSAAQHLRLPAGIPILMGCLDIVALAYGAGLRHLGDSLVVLGTTAAAMLFTDEVDQTGETVGATLRLPDEGHYLRILGANSGTSTLDWYRTVVNSTLDEFWSDVASGQPGVTMLPYLAGERVPFLAPDATGTFIGLTPTTGRPEIARSVAHGITYSLRHCLDSVGTSDAPIVLTGGGTASKQWCQLVADVTQRTVKVDYRPHVACVGLAQFVAGGTPPPAGELVNAGELASYEPQADYTTEYKAFVELGQRLRPIWSDLVRDNSDLVRDNSDLVRDNSDLVQHNTTEPHESN